MPTRTIEASEQNYAKLRIYFDEFPGFYHFRGAANRGVAKPAAFHRNLRGARSRGVGIGFFQFSRVPRQLAVICEVIDELR